MRRLRPLSHDIAAVQRLHEAAADYLLRITGLPPQGREGAAFFADLPPGKRLADKFSWGVCQRGELVGCIDVIRGWPDARTAMLGLLLLVPAMRGRGIGARALAALEAELARWPGVDTLRIAVVASNAEALSFWQREGFVPVGAPKPHAEGTLRSSKQAMQRALRRPVA